MVNQTPILVPPTVVVVGDIGDKALDAIEQTGLSVRIVDRRAAAFSALGDELCSGLIMLDMRIPEQMLDTRIPEQMEQLLTAAARAREFADVIVLVLSEFEEVREDRAAGLFVCRTFDAATLRRISRSAPAAKGPPSSRSSLDASKVIMVVEDDADLREALAALLYDAGYGVATATHGREALAELALPERPALVLLDLMMPVLDGWGFMAEFKRDPALSSIPVVVLSAGSRALFDAAPAASAYLEKPLDRGKLLRTIRACLEERRGVPQGERGPPG